MKTTFAFLAGLALMLVLGGGFAWSRVDPEFKRAITMNLKSPEIDLAIKHYNSHGVKTSDITQKQLNDYILVLRAERSQQQ